MRLRRDGPTLLMLGLLGGMLGALASCDARESDNPFTGRNGAAVELPFGDGTSASDPEPPAAQESAAE